MRQKSKSVYIVMTILILAALGITFYRNLSYRYEMQGTVVDLSSCRMELYGYDAVSVGEESGNDFSVTGKEFMVTGDDPQLMLEMPTGTVIGGIAMDFERSADHDSEPLPVQIFYAKGGKEYTERHSVKSVLRAGERSLLIPIPPGEYQTLRIDIDGDFRLARITGCTELMKAEGYVSQETKNACLRYFPAIIVGFCLIFWAHGVRFREGAFAGEDQIKRYVKSVFLGAEPSKNREVYLDYLRILAAILVILGHTCSPMVDLADTGWKRLVLVCGLSLGHCSNLLYVMLSGTLLLNTKGKQEEHVLAFYIRRASKVIIPLIAYYLLLLSINKEVQFFPPRNLGSALKRIVTGAPDVAPHLWMIYVIVALYFVTPFFKVMMQNMSDRLLFSLAAVILVLNMLTTYLPLFGMTFGATTFLAGWEGVFLLGCILTRQNELAGAPKRNRMLMLAAVVSYIIIVAVVFQNSSWMSYVYGSTPTMIIASCGVFCLFMANKDRWKGKSNVPVRLCAKYSYSIILIHWYALFVVVQGKLHITALRFGCIGGIAASVAAAFAVCIVMAVVFDNTVVIVCSVIFDRLTAAFLKHKKE